MEPQFAENGAFYLLKSGQFRKVKHRFFGRMELFPMHPSSATELDDPADIAILEGLLRRRTDTRDFPTVNDIDAIVFDFDGVFTNDLVSVDENGKESAVCSRSDGMGISLLKERFQGPILILSRETVPIVQHRAAKLKLECMHGKEDKLSVLKHWAMDKGIPLRRIAFVGNDVNDRECLKAVGYAFSPADGHGSILHEVDFILHNKGGEGAVREFCDRLLGATTAELNRINYDTN
jgi:N-acylneuraminate cytidylyltransferase